MNYNEVEILLVEDNMEDAELTIYTLNKINLANHLFHVRDGAEALDFIFAKGEFKERSMAKKPKVILLDIKMPKVDGIEVLRKIKGNKATKGIPVVIMTSSKEEQDIITSYDLGVNSYVVKPIHTDEFVKAVSELGLFWLIINQTPQT
jgi:two-component system response regulator